MIHIENLVKRYGSVLALDHLSLDIQKGEIFGLLGPNGSGKTTAIGCILSLLKYDKGTVTVFGEEMRPDSYELKKEIAVISSWKKQLHLPGLRTTARYAPENYPADFFED